MHRDGWRSNIPSLVRCIQRKRLLQILDPTFCISLLEWSLSPSNRTLVTRISSFLPENRVWGVTSRPLVEDLLIRNTVHSLHKTMLFRAVRNRLLMIDSRETSSYFDSHTQGRYQNAFAWSAFLYMFQPHKLLWTSLELFLPGYSWARHKDHKAG